MAGRKSVKHSKYMCYAIQHNHTGKIYVGISCNVQSRIYTHLCQLKNQTHKNIEMLADYIEYGNDYSFFILQDDIDFEDKFEIESKWMNELKTYDAEIGYNSKDKRFNKFVDMKKVKIIKGVPTTNKTMEEVV